MTLKSKIAALAAVITVVAAPAFAGDQDTATELRDVPELVTPVRANAFNGAYASAVNHGRSHKQGQSSIPSGGENDFQLEGR
jgi:hypothetical protein